jgi:Zn-finger protein
MSYKFVQNRACEYFPCHKLDEERFKCLFCYCPLYTLKDKCGGNFEYIKDGVKSCENCTAPHNGTKGWDFVNSKIDKIIDLAKL